MTWQAKGLGLLIAALVTAGAAFYLYDWERRIAEAQAKAEKAEESARRMSELEAERVWLRLDEAARDLEPQLAEPKRREAVERLKQEIQRLKSSFKYRQLGAGR